MNFSEFNPPHSQEGESILSINGLYVKAPPVKSKAIYLSQEYKKVAILKVEVIYARVGKTEYLYARHNVN